MGIGFRELVIILVIVILVFGTKRLPSIMSDVAKGIKSFKDGMKGEEAASDAQKPSAVDDKTTPSA